MTAPPLTADQISELRSELERRLKKLQKSMKVTDEALKTVELDQTAVGRLSRIDSLQNQSMSKGLREREIVQLSQIREALERMDRGAFGKCEECGDGIPFERLFIFPEAPACAACVT